MNSFFVQRQLGTWWTRNARTVVYFLRELTGPILAIYAMMIVTKQVFWPSAVQTSLLFIVVHSVGLAAALFHTITWFWVTVTISPVPLPKRLQIAAFVGLLGGTAAVSYLAYPILYGLYGSPAL